MTELNLRSEPLAARNVATHIVDVPHGDSAVSWAAIFAGAAGAAALSLLLMLLGTGLGFSAISPWRMEGISATTLGVAAIVWLSFTQLAASGVGGYLAGRLRTRWTAVHSDEVYFRDTAHGFLTWAIASLLSAAVLTSVIGTIGSGVKAGAEVVGAAATSAGTVAGAAAGSAAMMSIAEGGPGENNSSMGYFIDSLFRGDNTPGADRGLNNSTGTSSETAVPQANPPPPVEQADGATTQVNPPLPQTLATTPAVPKPNRDSSPIPAGEVSRIFARALQTGALPQEDSRYIAQLIAQRTGLSEQEAEQRVTTGFEEVRTMLKSAETMAREAADEARKASAYTTLWMTVALLFGAFFASLMAVFGGRQRDA